MKVLLINVCIRRDTPKKIYPVGLGYVASAIRRSGRDFDILDIDLRRYSDTELEALLRKKDFDVVCMGCIVTGYKVIKNICSIIKSVNKDAIIIVGNSVATSIPRLLLHKTKADIAVMGEGDITIVELLKSVERREALDAIAGICFRKGGDILTTKPRRPIDDINSIPAPDWSLFDMESYLKESGNCVNEPCPMPKERIRAFPVNTARGCIYKCTFCYHVFMGEKYRYRSPESIVSEMKELKRIHNVNYINFWDELTFFSKKQASALISRIIEADLGIFWVGSCRADLFQGDEDIALARKFKQAGCVALGYSLESANENILRSMNKLLNKENFAAQKRILDKAGIFTWTSLVFGYPEETEETIAETMGLCYDLGIYPSAGYLLPQPGTPMYRYIIEKGMISDEEDYILQLGDRQDLRINLTSIPSEKFISLIKWHLGKINDKLRLNLNEEALLKTGHYKVKSA